MSDRLLKARVRLMLDQPYLASAVARLPLVELPDPSWCTTMATDGYHIAYSPKFVAETSDGDLFFVLAHEVAHVILGHIDRKMSRERHLWNVATDLAANLLLEAGGMAVPEAGLRDRKYAGMAAEQIYAALLADRKGAKGAPPAKPGTPAWHLGQAAADLLRRCAAEGGFDLHVDPTDLEADSFPRDAVPSAIERAWMRQAFEKEVRSHLAGRGAGLLSSELTAAAGRTVPWEQLLARFFLALTAGDWRSFPFNRRHVWRGIYLPSLGKPGPEWLVVAVDTSGSMSDESLSAALGEIDQLKANFQTRLTLVECDAKIQNVAEFDPWQETVLSPRGTATLRGRGGTDLRPPFDWMKKQTEDQGAGPDAFIYFTDGFGPFPTEPGDTPVLWIVPEKGLKEFPFGQQVRVPQ